MNELQARSHNYFQKKWNDLGPAARIVARLALLQHANAQIGREQHGELNDIWAFGLAMKGILPGAKLDCEEERQDALMLAMLTEIEYLDRRMKRMEERSK